MIPYRFTFYDAHNFAIAYAKSFNALCIFNRNRRIIKSILTVQLTLFLYLFVIYPPMPSFTKHRRLEARKLEYQNSLLKRLPSINLPYPF